VGCINFGPDGRHGKQKAKEISFVGFFLLLFLIRKILKVLNTQSFDPYLNSYKRHHIIQCDSLYLSTTYFE
jgi:hypothetical protein